MSATRAATKVLDPQRTRSFVGPAWQDSIVPALRDYIRIPNQSPAFDAQWAEHGHMERAVELVSGWCRRHLPAGASLEVQRLPGRTPLLVIEVPGTGPGHVLLYGHLDKQPPMTGWEPGLSPWEPVLRGGRLYGRGAADDGYAAFASLTALRSLADQGVPHAHCCVLIEASEESGSPDLPAYLQALERRLAGTDLVVCLDSGCGNYEQLWCTTSLRGLVGGTLTVEVLSEGVHSGDASGIVPETFRVLRQLLERIEDGPSGAIKLEGAHVAIPEERVAQARAAAGQLGAVAGKFPFLPGVRPMGADAAELILARTWKPWLAVVGQDGLPPAASAGNVLRPRTSLKLSLRVPPGADADRVSRTLKSVLESDPPYGARVRFESESAADGWNAPALAPWLDAALQRASQDHFGQPAAFMGEGGTIPFMAMLGRMFPQAQFMITGVLGPQSNAHGPNEFLDLATGERLTACVASVLADHHGSR